METEQVLKKSFYVIEPDEEQDQKEELAETVRKCITQGFYGFSEGSEPYGKEDQYIVTIEKVLPEEKWWLWSDWAGFVETLGAAGFFIKSTRQGQVQMQFKSTKKDREAVKEKLLEILRAHS